MRNKKAHIQSVREFFFFPQWLLSVCYEEYQRPKAWLADILLFKQCLLEWISTKASFPLNLFKCYLW